MKNTSRYREILMGDVQRHFELVTGICIFFPTLVYSFWKLVGQSEIASTTASLSWVSAVALYLIIYVIFEGLKNHIHDRELRWLNRSLLVEIFLFVFPISVLASHENKLWGILGSAPLRVAVISLQVVPVMTILFFGYLAWKNRQK